MRPFLLFFFSLLIIFAPIDVEAQDQSKEEAINQFKSDFTETQLKILELQLNFKLAVSQDEKQALMEFEDTNEIFAKMIDVATDFQKQYGENPYISITGFTFELSFPPSVSFHVQFK